MWCASRRPPLGVVKRKKTDNPREGVVCFMKAVFFKSPSCPFACGNVQLSLGWHISSTCMMGGTSLHLASLSSVCPQRASLDCWSFQTAQVAATTGSRAAAAVVAPSTAAPRHQQSRSARLKVSCGQATIGSLRSLGAVTHRPITRLPITCPPRRARAARLLATAAARPRAATLPCAPDRARAAQTARALARVTTCSQVSSPMNTPTRRCHCILLIQDSQRWPHATHPGGLATPQPPAAPRSWRFPGLLQGASRQEATDGSLESRDGASTQLAAPLTRRRRRGASRREATGEASRRETVLARAASPRRCRDGDGEVPRDER